MSPPLPPGMVVTFGEYTSRPGSGTPFPSVRCTTNGWGKDDGPMLMACWSPDTFVRVMGPVIGSFRRTNREQEDPKGPPAIATTSSARSLSYRASLTDVGVDG